MLLRAWSTKTERKTENKPERVSSSAFRFTWRLRTAQAKRTARRTVYGALNTGIEEKEEHEDRSFHVENLMKN
jgi:hypothetical protein